MKNAIISALTILIIFYLAGSFTFASFDINQWNGFARGFIAFVSLCFSGFAFAYVYEQNNKL